MHPRKPGEAERRDAEGAALSEILNQLRQARKKAGLTLAEVAGRTGLAVETLSRLETGAAPNPTFSTLSSYAAAVGRKLKILAEPAQDEPDEDEAKHDATTD